MAKLLIPTDTSQATLGYLLADGTIPLTADWDVGAFDIKHENNKGIVLGTSDEAKISFDGADLVVNAGGGDLLLTGGLDVSGHIAVGSDSDVVAGITIQAVDTISSVNTSIGISVTQTNTSVNNFVGAVTV